MQNVESRESEEGLHYLETSKKLTDIRVSEPYWVGSKFGNCVPDDIPETCGVNAESLSIPAKRSNLFCVWLDRALSGR